MDSQQSQPAPETRLHFLDYWRIIRIRKAIIITVFLITAIIATAVTYILPTSYSSTSEIKIEPDTGQDITGMSGQTTTTPPYDPYYLQTELKILDGPIVLGKVIDAMNLNVVWAKKYGVDTFKTSETLELLQHQIDLEPVRNTDLVDITAYSGDKNEAANLANAVAKAYQEYRLEAREKQTQGGIESLQKEYQEEDAQIKAINTNVDNLRQELKIVDTDPNSFEPSPTLTQEQLNEYHTMMMEGQTSFIKAKEQLDQLKALPPQKLQEVLPTVNQGDTELSTLLDKLNEAEQNFVTLTNDYSLANPNVIRVQSLIAKLKQQVSDRVAGIMTGLENNLNTEKAALDALTAEVATATKKDQDEAVSGQPYWAAKRRLATMEDYHKALATKIEQEKIDLAIPKTSVVEITTHGEVPKDPVRPNKPLNISLGIVFGLLMGVGLAFFIEYLDTSVKTIDDVERAFQAPVLGVIPQNVGVLADETTDSRYAEAYRVLRTNILFSRKDEKLTTMVVVSAGAGEGKSTTSMNLATVFAQAGQRVLIVDSDLRRPTLHKLLHVNNNIGLTNFLLKQNTLEEVIQTTGVPMLHFMASGKLPNSSMSILNSAQMMEMIAELKQRYDFVLFDSPPILGVSDASILASEMDMVIQVIQYRRYPQPMSIRAKQLIEKVGGTFVGIVLNNINMSQDESYYYYSGYYHDYYSNNQETPVATTTPDAATAGIKQKY
ncbi:MAG: GumC family protein [Limisphaerales bacterium]